MKTWFLWYFRWPMGFMVLVWSVSYHITRFKLSQPTQRVFSHTVFFLVFFSENHSVFYVRRKQKCRLKQATSRSAINQPIHSFPLLYWMVGWLASLLKHSHTLNKSSRSLVLCSKGFSFLLIRLVAVRKKYFFF